MQDDLPVVVIGAGPQGLAAAAHLVERRVPVLILEAGDGPAASVAEWGHVRLFSEWDELVDQAARRLLAAAGWSAPPGGYPTGAQWISAYLAPLAALLGDRVRYGARVVGVSRRGRDRLVDFGRTEQPFTVHVNVGQEERRIEARAVVDASGTWSMPGPAGADGLPAVGEKAARDLMDYRIPDDRDLAGYAGAHTVVIGSGHSAMTTVIGLARTVQSAPGTKVTWVLRRGGAGNTFGGGAADELPARGQLGLTAQQYVDAGLVDLVTGFRTVRIDRVDARAVLYSEDGRRLAPVDRVTVLTGFRPDLSFLSELRLGLDPALQAPAGIASEIDPNVHSCGSVAATGARDLVHPEPDFYIVGAKSYGRAPMFLAMAGYEQVRSVVAQIAGDHEAAARVELMLPDSGVCGGAGLFDVAGVPDSGSCCAPRAPLIRLGSPATV